MSHFKLKSNKNIKFNIQLDSEQKRAKESILFNQITVLTGSAGTGKTTLVSESALDLLFRGEINKIYISRPFVTLGDSIGFLPGDLNDKVEPYVEVITATMIDVYAGNDKSKAEKIQKYFNNKDIEVLPIQFLRGHTIKEKELLIVTESQNLNVHEMEAILTRLGKDGRIVIEGDNRQKDIRALKTGLHLAIELSENIDGIYHHHLVNNHRSGLVRAILEYIEGKE